MPLINLKRVINSPSFSQWVSIHRTNNQWLGGRITTISTSIFGCKAVVTIAKAKELAQFPQQDFIIGAMIFKTTERLYLTGEANSTGMSDVISWNGELFKVISAGDASSYGFYKNIAVRLKNE